MKTERKDLQLQLRVSAREKNEIRRLAKLAKMGVSAWILSQVFSSLDSEFQRLCQNLSRSANQKIAFAELNDFLTSLTSDSFRSATENAPTAKLDRFKENYVAAMVEMTAHRNSVSAPGWTSIVEPLTDPFFGTDLKSLRTHLLLNSPPPFRRRNIFIDSSIGERV